MSHKALNDTNEGVEGGPLAVRVQRRVFVISLMEPKMGCESSSTSGELEMEAVLTFQAGTRGLDGPSRPGNDQMPGELPAHAKPAAWFEQDQSLLSGLPRKGRT